MRTGPAPVPKHHSGRKVCAMRRMSAALFVIFYLCNFPQSAEGQVINEILADPPPGMDGDSNCDGTRDWSEDEFVEIVNNTNQTLDISGYILRDSVAIRHEFPQGTTLQSFQAIVVFGGGSPASQGCGLGGAILQVANHGSDGIGLNNDGDTVTLLDDGGATLDTYSYGNEGGANQSLVRFPDICGSFQQHSTVAEAGAAFSPGTTVNGAVFDNDDSDSDGVDDCNDGCPSDPLKTEPGVCGCGVEDVDTDSDGIYDCNDGCPTLPYDCSADGMIIYVTSTDQSIQWAIDAAPSGGTIEIVGGTFMLSNPIDPEGKAITIRGAADPETNEPLTILDGGGLTRVISCTSGETDATEFENLCIQNGQELQGAGLRFHSSSPTLLNCTIQHNAATQLGGGVLIDGGSPSFTGCTIRENSAPNFGGGLFITNSTLSMNDCLLEGNSANWAGGMYLIDSTVDLVDCTASGNQSDDGASAISCRGGRLTIDTSTFDGNVTSGIGGAMFFETSIVELSNCDFFNNETEDDGSGAIRIWYSNFSLTIKLCRVWCNGQNPIEGDYTDGGANCITEDCTECPDRCDVDSDLDGVVDCMDECPANPAYTIAGACGCGMSEADSDGDGTPDCLDYDHLVLSYGNIQNAVDGAEDGEVIQLQPGMYLPAPPINTNGKQVTIRGALSDEGEILSILDGQTEHALLRCVNSESAGTVIENMVFQNGYSDTFSAGSAMDILGAGPTLRNCVFKNNEGAALYMDEASASLHGCVFEGNDYGLVAQQTTASLYECIVRNNHDKGILALYANHMELTDCSFFNNTGTDGAGIGVSGSVVILLRCEFSGNVAENGSAFYGSGSPEITMTHCSFMENSSSNIGGALYVSHSDNLHLSNCIIDGNSAGATAGGLYCQTIDNATFDACTFDGNIASSWGGGMSCSSITNLSLSHCDFRNNTNNLFNGGALKASSSDTTISSCTFENNTSAGKGGALYLSNSNTTLEDSELQGNSATYGGGIALSSGTISIRQCRITENSAVSLGGGLDVSNSADLVDSLICSNVPDQINGDYTDDATAPSCITTECDTDDDGVFDCLDIEECDGLDNDGDGEVDEGFDSDGDEVVDCEDGCPNDPLKAEPGICGCGIADDDSDGDGTADCNDGCPSDPLKTEPGVCGCGTPDDDSDGDGTADCNDICSGHSDDEDSDNDGTPDGCDPDTEWNVTPDDDLQTVIDGATAGQSIILGAGEYLVSGAPIQITIAPLSLIADGYVTLRSTDDAHSIIVVATDLAAGSVIFEGLTLLGPLDSDPFSGSGSTPVTSGGALNIASGMVMMHQCTMSNCSAEYGGAVAVGANASLELSECVVFDNLATVSGGGVFVETTGALAITSSAVCANAPDQIAGEYEADQASCINDECSDDNSDGTPDGCAALPCPADFNPDGLVDAADLGLLLAAWGLDGDTDITGDGTTDAADLGMLLSAWGPCP